MDTPARAIAKWRAPDDVWLDHTALRAEDVSWLAPVRHLTLWAVRMPDAFLRELPQLVWLDVRGRSGVSADFALGGQRLRYLAVNQVRGVSDLSAIGTLTTLELLSLYGLPRVTVLPDFSALVNLARLELGSMKGLASISPALAAPSLEDLMLIRSVGLAEEDVPVMRDKTSLREFGWFAEDVPLSRWMPVLAAVGKPKSKTISAKDRPVMRTHPIMPRSGSQTEVLSGSILSRVLPRWSFSTSRSKRVWRLSQKRSVVPK